MFNLVVTIISIALVAALALAAIYYGGDIYRGYSDRAAATRVINESTQLRAALALYRSEKAAPAESVEQLVSSSYLREGIQESGWLTLNKFVEVNTITNSQCETVNKMLGVQGILNCADPAYMSRPVCCTDAPEAP